MTYIRYGRAKPMKLLVESEVRCLLRKGVSCVVAVPCLDPVWDGIANGSEDTLFTVLEEAVVVPILERGL